MLGVRGEGSDGELSGLFCWVVLREVWGWFGFGWFGFGMMGF